MNLVTFKAAKRHVGLIHDHDDKLIEEKRFQASAIIIDYLKKDVNDTGFNWIDQFGEPTVNIPAVVQAATLLVIGSLYENRDGSTDRSPQTLSQSVIDLLMRSRDPAMA